MLEASPKWGEILMSADVRRMALVALRSDNGAMKQILDALHIAKLKPWQRRALVVFGAVAGSAAAYGLLRWLERRHQGKDPAVTERGEP